MGIVVESSAEDAKNADSGFPVYPAGQYLMEIIDVKPKKAANSGANADKPAIDVSFRITESGTGAGVGKKFTAFRVPQFAKWASGQVAFLFYQFYKAAGVVFEEGNTELPENEDLLGLNIGVTLKIEDAKDKEGNITGKRNGVVGFFSPDKELTVTATADASENTTSSFVL